MTTSGFDSIDATVAKTRQWIDEIAEGLGGDRHQAYTALRTVLHALRDRLPSAEAVDLGAQLPMLVRGLYYEGWRGGKPTKMSKADFLRAVEEPFRATMTTPQTEAIATSVLHVLARHISRGELDDVRGVLPKELRDLLHR